MTPHVATEATITSALPKARRHTRVFWFAGSVMSRPISNLAQQSIFFGAP
jgi:hypothetical protein